MYSKICYKSVIGRSIVKAGEQFATVVSMEAPLWVLW